MAQASPSKLVSAGTAAAAALGFGLLSGGTASASTASLQCQTTGSIPGTSLYSWSCTLYDTSPSGETWLGPALNPGSAGTAHASGQCRTVTIPNAYYITVDYTNAGVATQLKQRFLCSGIS